MCLEQAEESQVVDSSDGPDCVGLRKQYKDLGFCVKMENYGRILSRGVT